MPPDPPTWLEVRRRVAIAGVVTEAETGKPVEGANVVLAAGPAAFEKLRSRGPDLAETTTRGDGMFHFLDLPPGQYTVAADATGGGLGTAKSKGRVRADGPPLHVELPVPATRIEGKVTTADGAPVPLASVRVYGVGDSALTGADGTFALRRVELGERRVDVVARGFKAASASVKLTRAGTAKRVDIALDRASP